MTSFCRFVLPNTANIFKKKCSTRLWSLTTLNASTVSREEISTHITDRASLIDALDGKKAKIPLPKDYGTLVPAVSISKDARCDSVQQGLLRLAMQRQELEYKICTFTFFEVF